MPAYLVPPYFLILLRNDFTMQFRNGIYLAYGFVLAIFSIILFSFGEFLPPWSIAILVYADPSALGVFFLGALLMLEKSEGTRAALAVTPISASSYFWSKTITLTIASLIAVIIIALIFHPKLNWPLYLGSTVLTSIAFVAVGFPIAARFKTVSAYMMGAGLIFIPIAMPMVFAILDPLPLWANFIPAAAQLRLLMISLGTFDADISQILLLLFTSLITTIFCIWLAMQTLKREFSQK